MRPRAKLGTRTLDAVEFADWQSFVEGELLHASGVGAAVEREPAPALSSWEAELEDASAEQKAKIVAGLELLWSKWCAQ